MYVIKNGVYRRHPNLNPIVKVMFFKATIYFVKCKRICFDNVAIFVFPVADELKVSRPYIFILYLPSVVLCGKLDVQLHKMFY